jgi:DNA modification methylase
VRLPSAFIQHYTAPDEFVVEPFAGSGTSFIASERLRRRCYGMELSPAYCDVILRRWEAETGQAAVKVDTLDIDDGTTR